MRPVARHLKPIIAAAALATVGVACVPPSGPVVLSSGHIVFDVHIHDGAMEPHVANHETMEVWDHDQVVLHVPADARTTIPADPALSFLGAAGDPVSILPQNHVMGGPELLHLGFEAEEIAAGTVVDDEVHVEVTDVTGPGALHFYETDDHDGNPLPAPVVHFDTDDPAMDHAHFHAASTHHLHGAWAFTAPGQYVLTLKFGAELVGGGTVESVPTQFMFIVD